MPARPTRADRRNAARKDHALHAWKTRRWHFKNAQTGEVFVGYPIGDD